jgi:hypothetical protein
MLICVGHGQGLFKTTPASASPAEVVLPQRKLVIDQYPQESTGHEPVGKGDSNQIYYT